MSKPRSIEDYTSNDNKDLDIIHVMDLFEIKHTQKMFEPLKTHDLKAVPFLYCQKQIKKLPSMYHAFDKPLIETFNIFKKYENDLQLISEMFNGGTNNMFDGYLFKTGSEIYVYVDEIAGYESSENTNNHTILNNKFYVSDIHVYYDSSNQNAVNIISELYKLDAGLNQKKDDYFIEMLITTDTGGLTTRRIKLDQSYKDDDLDLHYGDNFNVFHTKLLDRVSKTDKGIVMLHGPPGNGKTHYIRRLLPKLSEIDKRVILIPKHIIGQLETPGFNQFMLTNFSGGQKIIFVIEDAESIISNDTNGKEGRSSLISTLLNITDGILNDIFSIQVILTFNTKVENIDVALMRKGRLIAKHEFKNLKYDAAVKLCEHLNIDSQLLVVGKEYSLAEIYTLNEKTDDEVLIEKEQSKKNVVGL